jgi:hypothetical protein
MEVSGKLYILANFTPVERNHCIHYTGGWVGAGNRLDVPEEVIISCPCRDSNLEPVVWSINRALSTLV